MTPTALNAAALMGCITGAMLMWIPFRHAGVNWPLSWANPEWQQDIRNVRFLSGSMALAFCATGAVFASRMLGL